MGTFAVGLKVGGAGNMVPVTAMVDTGAIHSMLPASLLAQVDVTHKDRIG